MNVKNRIELVISDNGPGIPKEYHKKIFKKFYRIPTGDIYNAKGFGLGLSYVKRIASVHKWKIKVESSKDKGTTFRIIMPSLKGS